MASKRKVQCVFVEIDCNGAVVGKPVIRKLVVDNGVARTQFKGQDYAYMVPLMGDSFLYFIDAPAPVTPNRPPLSPRVMYEMLNMSYLSACIQITRPRNWIREMLDFLLRRNRGTPVPYSWPDDPKNVKPSDRIPEMQRHKIANYLESVGCTEGKYIIVDREVIDNIRSGDF